MNFKKFGSSVVLAGLLSTPIAFAQRTVTEQEQRDAAKASQDAHDKRHHNTAKTVGGSAAGGAVVGGLLGGGKGAVLGAGVGAGGGYVADKIRKKKGTDKREKEIQSGERRY